jgi:hypothetical protein
MYFRKLKKRKGKPILSNWAEPEGPTQDRAGPAVGPRGAHLGSAARQQGTMAAAAGPLGVRARIPRRPRLFKAMRPSSACPSPCRPRLSPVRRATCAGAESSAAAASVDPIYSPQRSTSM